MTEQPIQIAKRDGRLEDLNLDKIHRVLDWAAEGLDDVSVSDVELKAHLQFHDGMTTSDIHSMLIKSTADLISAEQPDYQHMAARLAIFHMRKRAYGQFNPPVLGVYIRSMIERGLYDESAVANYTAADFSKLERVIDHSRDLNLAYAGVMQMEGKYLIRDRTSPGVIYETPQFLYMLIAMSLFGEYPQSTRLDYVIKFYQAASQLKISLPTPIMAGVRTTTRQFSSCVLIECADSLDSIKGTSNAIVDYISQRAGVGINVGAIRAQGSRVRNGEVEHTGVTPFLKLFQASVKSCSQGGVRGGAATVFYPLWHYEAETLLVLKNNRGVEENRVRQLDYGIQINKYLYQRLISKKDISLFSPHDVPGMYDAFFSNSNRFAELYEAAEADSSIRRKTIAASELFSILMQERASTGRIYIQNVDNVSEHGPFNPEKAPVKQSNLCLEILLPTSPVSASDPEAGEIALCTLAAFNLGQLESLDELEDLADILVRALDALLDYQDYPNKAAERGSLSRRSLGIGVVNYAYYLAKNGVKYSDGSANNLTHELFEAYQYHLLKASANLAAEKGSPCEYYQDTTYSDAILPIDRYKSSVDKLVSVELKQDWEALRELIKEHGLANSTLSSLMPSETSSQVSNATNGIEPPRGLVSVKQSKDGIIRQVVPEVDRLRDQYEQLWDIPSNQGYLELVAIMQKWVDQSISANTNYDPTKFPDNKVPMTQMLKDLLKAQSLGIKTLYYHNTRDNAKDDSIEEESMDCAGGACKI